MQLFADAFEFFEQRAHHTPFARAACDQVDDDHLRVLLLVPVNAPHPLFEPRRIPWDVVIDHHPAELQVDAFASCVGGNEEPSPAFSYWFTEEFDLILPLQV